MENLITCKICGKQSSRIYGAHLKSHGLTSDDYKKMFPGEPLCTEIDYKRTTINSGKHMKEDKYKKMFADKIMGDKNPNSKTRTTEEQRKMRSPFSKDFIKYNNINERDEFVKRVESDRVPESYNTKIEYWMKKDNLSYDDAELKLIERQKTFTLEICIDKYGKEAGELVYRDRQTRWQKSLLDGGKMKSGFSNISQILFYDILKYYDIDDRKNVHFATKNQEYFISLGGHEFYQYDFTDTKKMKMIEYNSDMYHARKDQYVSEDHPHPFRKWITAQQIWGKDESKLNASISKGFQLLTIWDSDYRKNPTETIEKCLEFLDLNNNI